MSITDWHKNRHYLNPGMVFLTHEGEIVQLDRTVPGDGTKWYVGRKYNDSENWSFEDDTLEPGDLAILIT